MQLTCDLPGDVQVWSLVLAKFFSCGSRCIAQDVPYKFGIRWYLMITWRPKKVKNPALTKRVSAFFSP